MSHPPLDTLSVDTSLRMTDTMMRHHRTRFRPQMPRINVSDGSVKNELIVHLQQIHKRHVQQQRINMLTKFIPLEVFHVKSTKLPTKVYLSSDRSMLNVFDSTSSEVNMSWPIALITSVTLASDKRIKEKKVLDRSITLEIQVPETSAQPQSDNPLPVKFINPTLIAQNETECKYWLDAFHFLIGVNAPSDLYENEVVELVEMDMALRMEILEGVDLPTDPFVQPEDPPELDFET